MPTSIPIPPAPPQAEPGTRNSEPETAPSRPPDPETAFPFPAARIPRGKRDRWTPYKGARARSTVFTPELVTEILETIERFGFTEAEAAVHCHVSTSTLDRWKREDPELEDFLVEARLEFASNQIHTISSFTRRDGQNDPQGAKWLLERSDPDRWGRPSARRNAAAQQHETRNAEPETASKKPPKPNTPEYWDYVEEEPWPRNLSTCTFTPGRQKFYAIYHLVSAYYRDQPKFRDQPSVDPESEQGKRGWESFFSTQETYFSLPKEQRIPYLHALFERQYEKVLTPEERAAADLAARGPCASRESTSCPSTEPAEAEASGITGVVRTGRETEVLVAGRAEVAACGQVVRGSNGASSERGEPPSCPNSPNPQSFFTTNENTTPTENVQNLAKTPPPPNAGNATAAAGERGVLPVISGLSADTCPNTPNPSPSSPISPTVFAANENTAPGENVQNLAEMPVATSAPTTTASAPQTAAPTAAPAPAPSVPAATPKTPPPQPPTPARRPIFRVKRRCISPDNPAWPQYQAALQREAMEEKLAEMEQLQAQGKPADSTHEAALAQYHELARQEQERLNRENEAFFNRPDDQDEEPITDCF